MASSEIEWLDGGVTAVPGILAGGVVAGIKPSGKKDLALIYSSSPARVAAVFTSNQVKGAPVLVSMEHVRGGQAQAIVASSGCANVCTGERGIKDAREMAQRVGELLRIPASHVLVASTGIIGVPLPMDKVRAAWAGARAVRGGPRGAEAAARADADRRRRGRDEGGRDRRARRGEPAGCGARGALGGELAAREDRAQRRRSELGTDHGGPRQV